jgi:hypothetical protein
VLAQRESAKNLKAAEEQQLAGSADRNSCRRLHRPQAAFRISNKTCFCPGLLLRTFIEHWRMLLNPKPAGQHANAAGISKSAHVHRDSGAQVRIRQNIRRSCTVQALSLRLVRPIE